VSNCHLAHNCLWHTLLRVAIEAVRNDLQLIVVRGGRETIAVACLISPSHEESTGPQAMRGLAPYRILAADFPETTTSVQKRGSISSLGNWLLEVGSLGRWLRRPNLSEPGNETIPIIQIATLTEAKAYRRGVRRS
jgi:hypothetical protein